ncbi:polyprenyl diphosphate synthase [Streptomyces sp. T-3]|nr:polyprenyl diphosphate synthase [Streptomyces sp. T-3]
MSTLPLSRTTGPAGQPVPEPEPEPRSLRHVAAILDGNRRWAVGRGLPLQDGYRAGGAKALEFLSWCAEEGVEVVTLMGASADNVDRRDPTVLADALRTIVRTLTELADEGRWRIRPIGCLRRLPAQVQRELGEIQDRTAHLTRRTVNIAVGYGGREELTDAVRDLILHHQRQGTLQDLPAALTSEDIAGRLYTAGLPDPDLVIRTSGEQRLSTFMPWQTVYSELCFVPALWPDFSRADFDAALAGFRHRQRRFGW